MKRRLSNLALSALTVAAVSGLTVLRTGLAADAAWRQDYIPLTVNTYPVSESFTGISVTDYYADVQLRVSRDGTVSVVTRDAEDVAHTVRVEGGTLTISRPPRGHRLSARRQLRGPDREHHKRRRRDLRPAGLCIGQPDHRQR